MQVDHIYQERDLQLRLHHSSRRRNNSHRFGTNFIYKWVSPWKGTRCFTLNTSEVRMWLDRWSRCEFGLIFSVIFKVSILLNTVLLNTSADIYPLSTQPTQNLPPRTLRRLKFIVCSYITLIASTWEHALAWTCYKSWIKTTVLLSLEGKEDKLIRLTRLWGTSPYTIWKWQ